MGNAFHARNVRPPHTQRQQYQREENARTHAHTQTLNLSARETLPSPNISHPFQDTSFPTTALGPLSLSPKEEPIKQIHLLSFQVLVEPRIPT